MDDDDKRPFDVRAKVILIKAHTLRDQLNFLCGDMERHDAVAYDGFASDMLSDFRSAVFDIQQAIDALSLHVEV
jgi:hypothetical protein